MNSRGDAASETPRPSPRGDDFAISPSFADRLLEKHAADVEPTRPRLPRRLGKYELTEELGRGGMGIVYKAREFELERWVAVKMSLAGLFASEGELRRFQNEARAAATLEHPGIIPVYETDQEDGNPYFVMKLLVGGSLAERRAAFAGNRACRCELGGVACRGGLLRSSARLPAPRPQARERPFRRRGPPLHHRLRPRAAARRVGERDRVRSDGRHAALHGTRAGGGTRNAVTTAADTYSLGAILYELIVGRPPFDAEDSGELLRQVLHEDPVAPSRLDLECAVPRDLETICLKCLAKDPQERYGTTGELAQGAALLPAR